MKDIDCWKMEVEVGHPDEKSYWNYYKDKELPFDRIEIRFGKIIKGIFQELSTSCPYGENHIYVFNKWYKMDKKGNFQVHFHDVLNWSNKVHKEIKDKI